MTRRRDREKQREYQRKSYQRNREQRIAQVAQRRREIREWLADYKATQKCKLCGEDFPGCLGFHHRNPDEKTMSITEATSRGWGKKSLLKEMAKCDTLCANCHAKTHFLEEGNDGR